MENRIDPAVTENAAFSADKLQEGIASLSRGMFFREAPLDVMLSILTEAAAHMSSVERASIWALTDDQEELRCLELYVRSSGQHSKGSVISAAQYPAYFSALRKGVSIAADDVYQHPFTRAFAADDRSEHRVTATLDTPIHTRGSLQGVFCLEQVGTQFPWTTAHRLFAQAVANLVTLGLVEHEAQEARRQAETASQRLRAVYDVTHEDLFSDSGKRAA